MTTSTEGLSSAPAAATQRPRRAIYYSRRYSRFVGWMKRVLPAIAILLLLLIGAWPRLEAEFERVRIIAPRIDLSEARDLRMVMARYTGIDRENRPFVLTAEVARQTPNTDDLVSLEGPKGDLITLNGGSFRVIAYTGVYQPQSQLLDLFGKVQFFQNKVNEFRTESAHFDMAGGNVDGQEAVEGHGPFGHVTAEGFRIYDHGDTIIFTGRAHLELAPRQKASP